MDSGGPPLGGTPLGGFPWGGVATGKPPCPGILLRVLGVVEPSVFAKEDHLGGEKGVRFFVAVVNAEGVAAEHTPQVVQFGPLAPASPCVGGGSPFGMDEHGLWTRFWGHVRGGSNQKRENMVTEVLWEIHNRFLHIIMTDWGNLAQTYASMCNALNHTAFEKGKFTCAWCLQFSHAELRVVKAHEASCPRNDAARGLRPRAPRGQVMSASLLHGHTAVATTVSPPPEVTSQVSTLGPPTETSPRPVLGAAPEVVHPARS